MSQRQSKDQRRLEGEEKRSFPFKDSNGERVLEERRKQRDRRMSGIDEGEGLETPWQFEN